MSVARSFSCLVLMKHYLSYIIIKNAIIKKISKLGGNSVKNFEYKKWLAILFFKNFKFITKMKRPQYSKKNVLFTYILASKYTCRSI